jgi:hypothetical protein
MWSVLVEKVFTAGKNHKDGKLIADEARHFLADGKFCLCDFWGKLFKTRLLNNIYN